MVRTQTVQQSVSQVVEGGFGGRVGRLQVDDEITKNETDVKELEQ